jgi:hypothetical protein
VHAGDSSLACSRDRSGALVARVGVPLADVYLEFLAGRCQPNTVRAAAYDLRVFFTAVRATRQLPWILSPAEVDALMAALRTHRDRAMIVAIR